MTEWYDIWQKFHENIQKDNEDRYNQSKLTTLVATLIIPLGVGVVVKYFFPRFSGEVTPTQTILDWIFPIASVCITCGACVFLREVYLGFVLSQRNKVYRYAEELRFSNRLEATLGGFLQYVKHGNFEKTLGWFGETRSESMRILMGKVIYSQLQQSFGADIIRIHIANYADHSQILAHLLVGVSDVCFTCIKSPRNWFKILDGRKVEHKPLPELKKLPPGYNTQQLEKDGISKNNVLLYPSHYVDFLRNLTGCTRRRAFILEDKEWKDLIADDAVDFYKKFIGPCQIAGIDTRLVNVDKLRDMARNCPNPERGKLLKAISANITKLDYDVFEKSAAMVYKESADITAEERDLFGDGSVLEFFIGPRVITYVDFLDVIFSEKVDDTFGVYTVEKFEKDYPKFAC
ncbi:MAG: hypothetical protein ABSE89_11300 [Sedimentisphaerales bacterium]